MLTLESLAEGAARFRDQLDPQIAEQAEVVRDLRAYRRKAVEAAAEMRGRDLPELRAIDAEVARQLPSIEAKLAAAEDLLVSLKSQRRLAAKGAELFSGGVGDAAMPRASVVRPIVRELLRANDGLTYDEVYGLTRDRLADAGCGAHGLGLRVREALNDPAVNQTDDGYRLEATAEAE